MAVNTRAGFPGAAVDADVAVVGAGVVGCATALALARRGAAVALLEAEAEPGLAASGTNSGIVHTGFDSKPGELETELILRSAALRPPLFEALGLPLVRCGGVLRGAPPELSENAARNGVETRMVGGTLEVPGESITDPVAYTLALAAAAARLGADVRTSFRVAALRRGELEGEGGERLSARVIVNCAGLRADEVARLAGDDSFGIYPRKGEFLVFDPPAGESLDRILLPLPTKRTKGVLVFPTIDGRVVAGPTAVDGEDKEDWSVRPEARDEILPKAVAMWPPLEGAEHVGAYAGLRPAGRDGLNYLIAPSAACESLVNVAAIRSTGLTASLGIAERVCAIVEGLGVKLGAERPLERVPPPPTHGPWWRRTAEHRGA
jgi:glycerol-3-phosphate dehydrogenase